MKNKNLHKIIVTLLMTVSLTLVPVDYTIDSSIKIATVPTAYAEIKTYAGVGEYIMNDFENPDIAK